MDEAILLKRMVSFIDDYGDIFLVNNDNDKIVVKDGKENLFEIKITKM